MTAPLLTLENLTVRLGGREVVTDFSLAVGAGEVVGLAGPNGAGKTTLMRAALGLIPADGVRRLGPDPVMRLSPRERAFRAAWLPQEREIAWPVTVATLVALGRLPRRATGAAASKADHAAVAVAMARADVAHLAERPATDLSGGERARVLAARALAQEAPLLLADEPTAGLDPAHAIAMMATFRRLADDGGAAVVAIHDLGLAARWCTRLALLRDGRLLADGAPSDVLTSARVAAVYGVEAYIAETDDGLIVQPTVLSAETTPQ